MLGAFGEARRRLEEKRETELLLNSKDCTKTCACIKLEEIFPQLKLKGHKFKIVAWASIRCMHSAGCTSAQGASSARTINVGGRALKIDGAGVEVGSGRVLTGIPCARAGLPSNFATLRTRELQI